MGEEMYYRCNWVENKSEPEIIDVKLKIRPDTFEVVVNDWCFFDVTVVYFWKLKV